MYLIHLIRSGGIVGESQKRPRCDTRWQLVNTSEELNVLMTAAAVKVVTALSLCQDERSKGTQSSTEQDMVKISA